MMHYIDWIITELITVYNVNLKTQMHQFIHNNTDNLKPYITSE